MTSELFSTTFYQQVEDELLDALNRKRDILSIRSLDSPRAAGDAIESVVADELASLLGERATNYSAGFARRAMADLAFEDTVGNYYVVDVKTHRTDTKFSMPNLTSVRRLARFYEDDTNYFVILMVSYHVQEDQLVFTKVQFVPIEFLQWDCLTLGALGWGQIQIANANIVSVMPQSRPIWMVELCDAVLQFYVREIGKIGIRIEHFERLRDHWLAK